MASKSDASPLTGPTGVEFISWTNKDDILGRMKVFREIVDNFDFVLSHCAEEDIKEKGGKPEARSSACLEACNVLHIILHERRIELQTGLYWRCPSLHERFYGGWTQLWSSSIERPRSHNPHQKSADPNIWRSGAVDITWNL